jgi:DNA modification methylase
MHPSFDLKDLDCLAWLPTQKVGSFQTIVLDPPYNVGFRYGTYRDSKPAHIYLHEQMLVLGYCAELLQEGGSLFYLNYPEFAAEVWGRVDFLTKVDLMPWVYHTHLGGKPLRRSSRSWLWFSKGEALVNQDAFTGEYRNPEDPRIQERMARGEKPTAFDWFGDEQVKNTSHEKRSHPCQVPEKMVSRFILGTSNPGDLVGDCYTGSGTTAICALRNGRSFAGCEMDPAYIQVVREAVGKIWKPDQTDKGFQNIEKAQMARREALEKVEIRRVI